MATRLFIRVTIAAGLFGGGSAFAQQQTFVTQGGVSSRSTPFTNATFRVQQFQPGRFDRLDRIEWEASSFVTARGTVTNNSSNNLVGSINVSTTVSMQRVGGSLGNLGATLFPSGFSNYFVPARSTQTVFASASNNARGTLTTDQFGPYLGNGQVDFTISASTGSVFGASSPRIEAGGGLALTYVYTPIGLSQNDPIQRTSGTVGFPLFDAVPTDRWYQFTSATPTPAFRLDAMSATDRFVGVLGIPAGLTAPVRVFADGQDLGSFSAGANVLLPTPASTLILDQLQPRTTSTAFQLRFANATSSIRVTPVPAPTAIAVLSMGVVCVTRRRRRVEV
jgi:hypothetical protein